MGGRLKPLDVQREEKPGKYADGDGLYLIVAGPTSKNWSYRYWFSGRERWYGLGSLKDLGLADARLARDAARLRVKGDRNTSGVDIVLENRAAREDKKAAEIVERAKTFEQCAQAYIDENWNSWSDKHRLQWPSSLKRYAYPTIGQLAIAEIKPSHIHDLLKPIWVEKRETANRVRGRIETIIAKNVDVDDKDFRNPAELTKQLREKLPKRSKRVVRHHPALPYADAPRFMTELSGDGNLTLWKKDDVNVPPSRFWKIVIRASWSFACDLRAEQISIVVRSLEFEQRGFKRVLDRHNQNSNLRLANHSTIFCALRAIAHADSVSA